MACLASRAAAAALLACAAAASAAPAAAGAAPGRWARSQALARHAAAFHAVQRSPGGARAVIDQDAAGQRIRSYARGRLAREAIMMFVPGTHRRQISGMWWRPRGGRCYRFSAAGLVWRADLDPYALLLTSWEAGMRTMPALTPASETLLTAAVIRRVDGGRAAARVRLARSGRARRVASRMTRAGRLVRWRTVTVSWKARAHPRPPASRC